VHIDMSQMPQNETQRIAWLWDQLDAFNRENASLQSTLDKTVAMLAARDVEIEAFRGKLKQMSADMAKLGVEINAARVAAADSVQDYILLTNNS
jgi:hypothetical protein